MIYINLQTIFVNMITLQAYIETAILPRYKNFDPAHRIDHAHQGFSSKKVWVNKKRRNGMHPMLVAHFENDISWLILPFNI